DDFGWQARLADVNGDGRADLVVASPGTPVTNSSGKHEDAGVIYVLKSVNGAITGTGSSQYTQDTAGITGSPGKGDGWGSTLIANDLNGDGKADIVVTGTDRYVDYIPGSSSGPVTTSSKTFTQSTSGIVGTDTSGDAWGESLMAVSIKGAGPAALVVGAPGKHSGKGSISVLYSTSSGPTGTGSLYLDQDSTNVPGTAETGDFMGTFFQ
ncbi:MAG TPA: FG-GAP repeat protein, partial [Micromonosporaceae bacterium]